jgi:excinuclease UvrABC nuclease subunit
MCSAAVDADQLHAALPEIRTWSDRPGPAELASLPGCPAVYLLADASGTPVQLATTQSLKRALVSRLSEPQRPRPGKADLAEIARSVRWRPLSTPFEGRWWYHRLAREIYPRQYRRLISFGPAYFLHVSWEQPVPELRVTERVWCLDGHSLGPWPTHKACQAALEGLRDLFDLCRHPEQVRKAPGGTRCAYAEMGHCDAPCDGSAPLWVYLDRCRAAWRFAAGGAGQWIVAAAERMNQAADGQKYELAGLIKQQLEFARDWQEQWAPRVRPAEEMNYLLALPVTRRRGWKLLLFRTGHLTDGPVVPQRRVGPQAAAWLRAELSRPTPESPATLRMEQTWLVCHFLYSREAESALLVPLPVLEIPADLEQSLAEKAEAARQRRGKPRPRDATASRPAGAEGADEFT